MKRIMLINPNQYDKTSLTQYMREGALHYQKTQVIARSPATIDTPGEYLEDRYLYSMLLASACEIDIIVLVLNVDAPRSSFSPGFTGSMNRPVIGLVTKADLINPQRISLVESWLVQTGVQKIFVTSVLENTEVDEMFIFLSAREPSCLIK